MHGKKPKKKTQKKIKPANAQRPILKRSSYKEKTKCAVPAVFASSVDHDNL